AIEEAHDGDIWLRYAEALNRLRPIRSIDGLEYRAEVVPGKATGKIRAGHGEPTVPKRNSRELARANARVHNFTAPCLSIGRDQRCVLASHRHEQAVTEGDVPQRRICPGIPRRPGRAIGRREHGPTVPHDDKLTVRINQLIKLLSHSRTARHPL